MIFNDSSSTKKAVPKSDAVQAAQKQSAAIKASQSANEKIWKDSLKYLNPKYYKGVGSSHYKRPDGNGGGNNNNNNNTPVAEVVKPAYIVSQQVATESSNLVDNLNILPLYTKAINKIVMSLVRNSKNLITRYDFSGIDKITDYSLDADNSARQTDIVVSYIRPRPVFSLTEAQEQDIFMKNVNIINNLINDFVPDSSKFDLFGSEIGDTFYGGTPKIVSNQSLYDLQIKYYTTSGKKYRYRLYEIQ